MGSEAARQRISSGGPWEQRFGYSRAVVRGDTCSVSGTTDAGPDGRSRHPGDAGAQARAILELIDDVLARAGFMRSDVVRTRMYLIDAADVAAVGMVHGAWFADIQPAATMVIVAGLIEPSLRVEIEVDAVRG
jgi:enamine deaminase RidA (YjgF/YER057c/UK114 family)